MRSFWRWKTGLLFNQQPHHIQKLLTVGHICQIIPRDLAVLQMEINYQHSTGSRRPCQNNFRINLLDKNNKYRKKRERCQNAVYRPLNLFPVYYRHAQTGQTVKIKDQIGEIKTASPFISVRAERKQHSRQRIGQYHQRVGHTRNHPKNEPPSQ